MDPKVLEPPAEARPLIRSIVDGRKGKRIIIRPYILPESSPTGVLGYIEGP